MSDRRPFWMFALLVPLSCGIAAAQPQGKCLAAKNACAAKKLAGLLKCYRRAQTPGKPADPDAKDCITKVMARFDGGEDPSKGCFARLEAKRNNDCQEPLGNTAAVEAIVDRCVGDVVAALEPARANVLDLTITTRSGACGETRDGSGGLLRTLACGGLYVGGGNSGFGEGVLPAGAVSRFALTCTGSSCTVGPTGTAPAPASGDPDCTAPGCSFGVPVAVPVPPPVNVLSLCAVNRWSGSAGGALDLATGDASLEAPLSVDIFLTGGLALQGEPLCPRCSAGGTPGNPGIGTCGTGARAGQPCASTNPDGYTRDCPPRTDTFVGTIPVDLSPLKTAAVTATAANGLFCPGQTSNPGNSSMRPGCFAQEACRSYTENGVPAGAVTPGGGSKPATLASTFCIPASGNTAVDGSSDLPGPGALSLPVTFLVH